MSHRPKHSQQKNQVPIGDAILHIEKLASYGRQAIRLKFHGSFHHQSTQLELLVFGAYDQKLLSALLSLQCSALRACHLLMVHGVQLTWNQELDTFDLEYKEQTHTLIHLILALTLYQKPHTDLDI